MWEGDGHVWVPEACLIRPAVTHTLPPLATAQGSPRPLIPVPRHVRSVPHPAPRLSILAHSPMHTHSCLYTAARVPYTQTYACPLRPACTHRRAYEGTRTLVHTRTHVGTHMYARTHTRGHTCTRHTCTHTCTRAYTHSPTRESAHVPSRGPCAQAPTPPRAAAVLRAPPRPPFPLGCARSPSRGVGGAAQGHYSLGTDCLRALAPPGASG